jgi:predicted nucleotidyltransferase
MSVVCGIEIKSKTATLLVLDGTRDDFTIVPSKPLKIELSDSSSQESIKNFSDEINKFITNEKVEKIIIKEGVSKGKFTSGSPVFKIETIIQMSGVEVTLLKPQLLKTFLKDETFDLNDNDLKKYQQVAYEVAYYGLK